MSRYLNWRPWVYGLVSSIIGGGAAAVSAAIGVNLVDSKDWNVSDHPGHLFMLMATCFAVNAAISTFAYLSKSPLPQEVETVVEKTNTQPDGDGTQTTTIRKTMVTPVVPKS